MFGLLRAYRRRQLKGRSLSDSWLEILARYAPFRGDLNPDMQRKLDQSILVMVAEKNWEGCGGLRITDDHRVAIAAHAARLTLGFPDDYFDELSSILVYPAAYEATGTEMIGPGLVLAGPSQRVGEAWYRGPVVLAWSDIVHSVRRPGRRRNVILHEFAHHLDMRNGRHADGVPVIEAVDEARERRTVTKQAYDQLCQDCFDGRRTLLDCYGATDRAEFFAVATETFFEAPHDLARALPELYQVLTRFYRQPSTW